jgi:hypothetical protein
MNAGVSSADRFDRAWKFRQGPVAGVLHDAAAVFGNCRGDRVVRSAVSLACVGIFVAMHKPLIASDVSGQYRRRPALDSAPPAPWPTIQCDCTTDQMDAYLI